MSILATTVILLLNGLCFAQQGIDPAYLTQYYQQVAAQAGARAAAGASHHEATPIFETNQEQSQTYLNPGQQIRIKDNVQDQARAQQQQTPQHTQAYIAPSVREYLQQPQQQIQYTPQPQAQPLAYKQSPAKQQFLRRPQVDYQAHGGKLDKDEAEDYDPNPSYQFGFDVKDDEFTNYQNRKEVRDGNVITGSYSVVDSDGFIRTVKYTADPKEGFKAEVIREPTDIVVKIPTPQPATLRHHGGSPQQHQQQQYLSHQPKVVSQPQYQQYHQ